MLATCMSQNMNFEAMVEKEKRAKQEQDMNRAKVAVEQIKRARHQEGPEDPAVYNISKRVNKVITERGMQKTEADFDATIALSKGAVNDRIRQGMREEGRVMQEQYELIGGSEPI